MFTPFKLLLRLIGFLIFFCTLSSLTAVLALWVLGWVDLNQYIPSLPAAPPIDTGGIPGDPFGRFTIPADMRPGDSVLVGGFVNRQPLFSEVPVPQQLSTEPRVIGANALLAIFMMLIFGTTSSMLSNMLRDEEPRIQAWLRWMGVRDLAGWMKSIGGWTLSRGVRRGCLTLPLVALIFAIYGIIFAYLQEGTSIFSREGIFLAMTLAFSVGLVSFSGDIARRIVARWWRQKSWFSLYPVNLLMAVATVIVSRVVNLSPGIVFGTPGGANIEDPPDPQKQERIERALAFTTVLVLAIFGTVGWIATAVVVNLLDAPFEARIAPVMGSFLSAITNLGLAVFLIALETSFFELMPIAYSSARPIFRWNKLVWGAAFLPVAFLFAHAILNPEYGFLESFMESDIRFVWFMMLALMILTAGLWFYFNVLDDILQEWFGVKRRPRVRAVGPYYPPQRVPYDPGMPPRPDRDQDQWSGRGE